MNLLTGSVDDIFCLASEPYIFEFWTDCLPTTTTSDDGTTTVVLVPSEIQCSCCTDCCDTNDICEEV